MNELNSPAIHGEQVAGRGVRVRKTLNALSAHLNINVFDIAELLYEAQENNYVYEWGYESIPDFAEKELGIKESKARYLARIVRIYRAVGLTRKDCEGIHTSKLREISSLNPEGSWFNKETKENEPLDEHIVRLITDARDMTLNAIKEEVAKLKGQVGPDRRVIRSFSTTQSAWDNVFVPAMEKIRRRLGSENRDNDGNAKEYKDGVVYEMMAAEINADPNFEEPLELPNEVEGLVADPETPVDNSGNAPVHLPQELI